MNPFAEGSLLRAERAVGAVFVARLLPLLAAPATMWLVATRRPVAEQGFYVIFQNVQALAQLAEIGLGALVVQFVAHESGGLRWSSDGGLLGEAASLSRIGRLVPSALRWYGRAALVLLLGVPLGWALFSTEARHTGIAMLAPWALVVVATAAYLVVVPLVCLAEGAGHLVRVQQVRSVQALAAVAALWVGILTRDALWGMTYFAVVWLMVPTAWLIVAHLGLLRQTREWMRQRAPDDSREDAIAARYVAVQGRTAASSLALWAAPQALAPALLVLQGAGAAGRAGFSLALATAPATLGTAWLFARYPRLGAHVARGRLAARDALARQALTQALAVCAMLGLCVTAGVAALGVVAPSLASRALPAPATGMLAAASLGWVAIQGWAAWLRAERQEPLTPATVTGAVAVIAATVAVAGAADASTTAAAYALAVLAAATPLAGLTFLRTRRSGQAAMAGGASGS
ncbi:MAG TPA: hypothetical protein VL328_16700 [Gemmatimonadaceae bacterium]|nr:hypothetical protein [Gemmatimonadaceae bacterium]